MITLKFLLINYHVSFSIKKLKKIKKIKIKIKIKIKKKFKKN